MKNIKYFVFTCMFACILSISSCTNDEGVTQSTTCDGTPQLASITTTTEFDVNLTSCSLGDWVVLHGQNLCAVKSIVVNGVSIDMREAFLETNKATLQVPRKLSANGPTNAIEVSNGSNSAKLNIAISIPELVLTGIDNEYASPNDTININGLNFDLYEINKEKGKVFFGDKEAVITATTEKYVSVIVPTGVQINDKVKVTGDKVNKIVPGQYRDNTHLFEGFEGGFGWAGTDPMVTDGTKPGDIKACNGKYLHIEKNVTEGWFAFIANGYNWPLEVYSNPEKWCMKFEIATISAITKKTMQNDLTKFTWKPWGVTEFTTYKKWKTITFEMVDVMNGVNHDPSNAILFQMSLIGDNPEQVNFCIDNFRLYKKE